MINWADQHSTLNLRIERFLMLKKNVKNIEKLKARHRTLLASENEFFPLRLPQNISCFCAYYICHIRIFLHINAKPQEFCLKSKLISPQCEISIYWKEELLDSNEKLFEHKKYLRAAAKRKKITRNEIYMNTFPLRQALIRGSRSIWITFKIYGKFKWHSSSDSKKFKRDAQKIKIFRVILKYS